MHSLNKFILALWVLFMWPMQSITAQTLYIDEVFADVETSSVTYSDVFTDDFHKMDIYQPKGDTHSTRPLLIYIHGGAFYAGDKATQDCIDFCTKFAKKGYVTASVNYRLANALVFLSNQDIQLDAVLKTMADVKASIRYFSKDAATSNNYRIDSNAVFVGGYSAGGVAALHTAWVTDTSELDEQLKGLLKGGIKTLDGDAGNYGYSSRIRGIFSLAGALYKTSYASPGDVPAYLAHAKDDETVLFNCGPALNNPMVVELCGTGTIIPRLDTVGIHYDSMILETGGHGWPGLGNTGNDFNQAIEDIANFFYPLLLDNVRLRCQNINKVDCNIIPNPSNGSFRVSTSSENASVKVLDVNGKLRFSGTASSEVTLNLNLDNGVYLLVVQTDNGIGSQRLVISN